jgi:hypothetical protein
MYRAARRFLPVLALWGAVAAVLATATAKVVDWFVMTDELLYERLAFSVARTGSPWPTLRGEHISLGNDLYPVVLSLVAGNHLVPAFLERAHILNAVLITSAAVPAFLIARDALRSTLAAYAVAALSVLVPWLVLASFLLTASVAYPAFCWGIYVVQRTVARPSTTADALALVGMLVATLARTQFAVLFLTAPLAVLAQERSWRRAYDRHRVLAAALGAIALVLIVLVAAGRGSSVLGFYSSTVQGSLAVQDVPEAFVQHLATVALALGILPFLLGGAWLLARSATRAPEPFPTVATIAVVLLAVEVASFDLRFGQNLPRDRYLFYIAPLVLTGFVGALLDGRAPRWSLVVPGAILLAGFETAPLPVFTKLNADTPAAIVDDYLLSSAGSLTAARNVLVTCTVLLLVVFVLGRAIAGRRVVALVLIAATAAATTAETTYAFDRLFRVNGTSGRPITLSQGVVFDWVDRTIGIDKDVTIVPYAQLPGDYWATAGWWWDMEFWNRSVTRGAYISNEFAEIQTTFPKLDLTFDPRTGRASISPTRYVAESEQDSRFRLRGPVVSLTRNVFLIDAGRVWQADWVSGGIDSDGFTFPGKTGTIRVFPAAGQKEPRVRYLTLHLVAPNEPLGAAVRSNMGHWKVDLPANGEADQEVPVCVPADRPGVIGILPHGSAPTFGDLSTKSGIGGTRIRGIWLNRLALADEIGPTCTP